MRNALLVYLLIFVSYDTASAGGDPRNDCDTRLRPEGFTALAEQTTRERRVASRALAQMFENLGRPRPVVEPKRERHCFTGGMRVSTPRGQVAIAALAVGDEVFSYDLERQAIVISVVTAVKQTEARPYGILYDLPSPIEVTASHRFFAERKGFCELDTLEPGDVFVYLENPELRDTWDGLLGRAHRGRYTAQSKTATVHEISLGDGPHNYFVEGVVVHNVKDAGV